MSDDFEQQEWVKFGVAATLGRQYAQDQRHFFELLANMLESALPGQTEVKYRGGLFSKKTLQRVTLSLGDNSYAMEDTGRGTLHAMRTHIVRGIALKTEDISVEDWVREIGAAVDSHAAENSAARDALARMLG